MRAQRLRRSSIIWLAIILFFSLVTLPYLVAARSGGGQLVFGGFLFNPLDGNSYLAKMYQGFRGDWRFTLPYTAEAGQGAYLFLFYLALGHLTRMLSISSVVLFHLARILGAIALCWEIFQFYSQTLVNPGHTRMAFLLALFGSGLGWLGVAWGVFTADFWVAEAFPFLSAYANPHFSISMALVLS